LLRLLFNQLQVRCRSPWFPQEGNCFTPLQFTTACDACSLKLSCYLLFNQSQVRCRSPWFAVGPLVRALEDTPDAETPTAAALSRNPRSSSAFSDAGPFSAAAAAAAGVPPVPPPPPPPPPRPPGSSAAGGAPAGFNGSVVTPPSVTSNDDLKALFIGDAWGGEPVWYYFDRSDQVQGPFSAREMIGWVSSGMLMEETRMCGADAKLGVSCYVTCYCTFDQSVAVSVVWRCVHRWCGVREMIGWVSGSMLMEETRMCGADAKLGVSCYMTCYSTFDQSVAVSVVWRCVQRWCGAWEMIGLVSSGMLMEETRMCGADAKLGVSCYVTCYSTLCNSMTVSVVWRCVRRWCGAREMIGWVSSGMLMEETRMCSADAKG
jgi:hypothetical protein